VRKDFYPILEHDPAEKAIIEPPPLPSDHPFPPHAVLCFFNQVIEELVESGKARQVSYASSVMGTHPIYEMKYGGRDLIVFLPGIGAPFTAAFLEEVIATGCCKIIVCGAAGVLDNRIAPGKIMVPTAAVRDDGTSYHYLPPAREVGVNPLALAAIKKVLRNHKADFVLTKTWTTDAFYRETPEKIRSRRREGCLAVEMEAAALLAVAEFRKASLGLLLCAADDVSGECWDERGWRRGQEGRDKLFALACEACLLL